jgi:HprK-related kinase A
VTAGVSPGRLLGQVPLRELAGAAAGVGLWLDVGLAMLRVRSDTPALPAQLRAVYANFPFRHRAGWADLHIELTRPRGVRRWFRPQVRFRCDSEEPFEPFPADSPLPLLEWGANWLLGRRMNNVLLLHAGVVERDGLALVMPATPGSGKSTLSAALSLRGWRLLSDEFGAVDLRMGSFLPVLKPVALKNESIDVIRRFAPGAPIGPVFPKTRKGSVAHLAASLDTVTRVHEHAMPGMIVLPKWQAGSATSWQPLDPEVAFSALAFNAFNYATLGEAGFMAAVQLARHCPAWQLIYSDLNEALAVIDAEWSRVAEMQSGRTLASQQSGVQATP